MGGVVMARRSKKDPEQVFYSLDNILSKNCHYNLIVGERSNVKTYAVLKYAIQQYAEHGHQLAILRRFREDFTGKRGAELFAALVQNCEVTKATDGRWNGIFYYASRWYFCKYEDDGSVEKDKTPFAFGFSITQMEHDKGTAYPMVKNIVFDEFITRAAYLPDEFILFTNTLSTIIRQRDDVRIFMLGNTVNKYCPYFSEMGLKHVKDMQQGDIDVYMVGKSGLRIAVEYCGTSRVAKKKSDIYFSFDNPKLEMITRGIWEMDVYPHCPIKYRPKDVLFTYFIEYDGELLQCEVIMVDGSTFTFIHRKTTPIKDESTDLVFTQRWDPRPNYRRKLTEPVPLVRKLYAYFASDKVFYQDNEVGEIVRNYLIWCGKDLA
jgi:hypothetical protein